MKAAPERVDELIWLETRPAVGEVPLRALTERPGPGSLVFVRHHFDPPTLDPASFRLTIGGSVARGTTHDLESIRRRPFERRTLALECAGNGRAGIRPEVPRVQWRYGGASVLEIGGTPLAPLLEEAGPLPQAHEAVFAGADAGTTEGRAMGYERSLPLAVARDPGILLVWEMNRLPLTRDHGFPLRLFVPGWYAMASVKWLTRITLADAPFRGYYQAEDYVYHRPDGTDEPVTRMRPRAVITSPGDAESLATGPVTIEGIAWSGTGRIERVLVSVDGGASWTPASLGESDGDAPRRWRLPWPAPASGRHEIVARARDASGHEQPLAASWNALGYGNNAVQRIRVDVAARPD